MYTFDQVLSENDESALALVHVEMERENEMCMRLDSFTTMRAPTDSFLRVLNADTIVC